jgi:hypothetical protein
MAIVGSLPVQLANNTLADATQVMSDLNYIVAQVNANAAALAASNNFTGTNTISGDSIITASATQTLTNKTINGVAYTASAQPGFRVVANASNQVSGAYVLFPTAVFDITTAVAASILTAPVAGIYVLTASVTINNGTGSLFTDTLIFSGSVTAIHGATQFNIANGGSLNVTFCTVAKLALNETVRVKLLSGTNFSASLYVYNTYAAGTAFFAGAQVA